MSFLLNSYRYFGSGIQYVGGTSAGQGFLGTAMTMSLTALSGGLSSTAIEGDFVIIAYCVGCGSDRAIGVDTSGYTELVELYNATGGVADNNLSVSHKFMGVTPDASVQVSATGVTNDGQCAVLHVYRGVNQTNPLDVAHQTFSGSGIALVNPSAITPVTPNAKIVVVGSIVRNGNLGSSFIQSDLSNFVSRRGDSTNDGLVGMGSVDWMGGAFNPSTWSESSALGHCPLAVSLALRPA